MFSLNQNCGALNKRQTSELWRVCVGELDGLVVQLGLQLLILRHLPHRLHEVLVNHVLPLRSAIQDIG
jgi:hypothetical protein